MPHSGTCQAGIERKIKYKWHHIVVGITLFLGSAGYNTDSNKSINISEPLIFRC